MHMEVLAGLDGLTETSARFFFLTRCGAAPCKNESAMQAEIEASRGRMTPRLPANDWGNELLACTCVTSHATCKKKKKKKKKVGRNPMPTPLGLFDLREHQRDRAPRHGFLPRSSKSQGVVEQPAG